MKVKLRMKSHIKVTQRCYLLMTKKKVMVLKMSVMNLGTVVFGIMVQIQTKARHQTRDHNNQFKMWALTFAARNRVSFNKEVVIKAKDIPLSLFLPSNADWN